MRVASVLLCAAMSWSCVRQTKSGPVPEPQVVQLIQASDEKETERFTERRVDTDIEGDKVERPPRVVTTGEIGPLELKGARARLYGDAQGTQGIYVDNVLLLEVLDAAGEVRDRLAVGFSHGVLVNNQRVDNVGPMSFSFAPGEIDITRALPDEHPFRLRATVLDTGGIGKVSDVFVRLEHRGTASAD